VGDKGAPRRMGADSALLRWGPSGPSRRVLGAAALVARRSAPGAALLLASGPWRRQDARTWVSGGGCYPRSCYLLPRLLSRAATEGGSGEAASRRGERFAEFKASTPGGRGASRAGPVAEPPGEWGPDRVRQMVEASMMSALGGLLYLLGTTLRLEGYAAYFLPLPMIVMAQRHSPGAAWRTLWTTATLLGVLFGPLKSLNYILVHGLFGTVMASSFQRGLHWSASVPLSALSRGLGILGSLAVSSFLVNENLFTLLVYNVEALLANAASALSLGGTPSPFAIQAAILGLVIFHCNVYAFLLHFLYSGVLPRMGLSCGKIPRLVARAAR